MIAPTTTTYNDFLTINRWLIAHLADRHRIELDDAKQEAWLAWGEACATWNPRGGASLHTWALRKLENRLRRLAAQARYGCELDAEGAPDLAAQGREEIEPWRREDATPSWEAVAEAVRDGTATVAERLGVTQRRARQIIAALIERAGAGTPQLDLF